MFLSPTSRSLKSIFPFAMFVILLCFFLSGCSGSKEDVSPEAVENAALIKDIVGEYVVEGTYDFESVAALNLKIIKESNEVLAVSAPGIPDFKLMKWTKVYQNGKDPDEYMLMAEIVGPDEGTFMLTFPEKSITLLVKIKIDNVTKKNLWVNGIKK